MKNPFKHNIFVRTYKDKKAEDKAAIAKVTEQLQVLQKLAADANYTAQFHSVCQHIRWKEIFEVIALTGITDLHVAHKTQDDERREKVSSGTRVHAWNSTSISCSGRVSSNSTSR